MRISLNYNDKGPGLTCPNNAGDSSAWPKVRLLFRLSLRGVHALDSVQVGSQKQMP